MTQPRMTQAEFDLAVREFKMWHDWLTKKLGLPPDAEPTFERFLSGKCREE